MIGYLLLETGHVSKELRNHMYREKNNITFNVCF